ncbi:MlaD family protein [Nocardia sp. NPDC056100]|uniref:MlaD family protein n=1 Tax=Nocardia sp. NPDC056100 TaxID=3345712 RepID=UPI0035DEA2D4
MNSIRTRRIRLAAVLAGLVLTVNGCAFDPSSVPIPGTTVSGDTYPLHIEFPNALNLPPGAKVIADGVEVGNLRRLRIIDTDPAGKPVRGYVIADIALARSVSLPGDVTATLQQSTPLGDVRIALTSQPGSTAAPLAADAVIPLARTRPSTQIEDTLAGLATALGSGAITDIQNTVRQINTALPRDPRDTARIFGVLGSDLTDVAGDLGSLDAMLSGLTAVNGTVAENLPLLDEMLTDRGTRHLLDSTQSVIGVLYIFTNLGPVAHSAAWLAPLLQSADAAARAYVPMLFSARPLDLAGPSNLTMLIDLIQNKLIPFAQRGPKVNLTQVTADDTAGTVTDRTDRILDTLRMIGAVQ